ncbi:hypothetical protein PGB28_02780 [Primorskyibacter aestuariivivens]|nr:hypothetical protein [Primorskyibacter aestuariivivens]MDA7427369.1 hypothetical protein [Primorskyibacter aestuariivivens]
MIDPIIFHSDAAMRREKTPLRPYRDTRWPWRRGRWGTPKPQS